MKDIRKIFFLSHGQRFCSSVTFKKKTKQNEKKQNKKQNIQYHLTTYVKTRDLFEAFGDQILYPSFVDHGQTNGPGVTNTNQAHSMTS